MLDNGGNDPDLLSATASLAEAVSVPPSTTTTEALANLSNNLKLEEPLTVECLVAVTQKELSRRLDVIGHEELLESADAVEDRARLASLSLPHSGDWLNVVPYPALGLHLQNS